MSTLLRDVFNLETVTGLADRIIPNYPQFDREAFITESTKGFDEISFGERLEQITDTLKTHMPDDYETTVNILLNSLTGELGYSDDFKFENRLFINTTLTRYVSKYGIDNFHLSINALKEMTKSFTSEYDIKYFIDKYQNECVDIMTEWADDENLHVRRLASEGSRPRLPMGKQTKAFIKDPTPILPILEKLKNDPVLYVRRSVANSLNDISKDHPDLAADIADRWFKEGFEHSEYVCNHAMRTLFKEGHRKALNMAGYSEPKGIEVWGIDIKNTTLRLGGELDFSFVLDNNSAEDMKLMIDYEILFVKNSKKLSPKVFKLKKTTLKSGKKLKLFAKFKFEERTTRKLYSGKHYVRVIVNGERHSPVGFYLHAE